MNYSEMDDKYSEMDDQIFKFVYVSAMRDATLRGAYSGKKAWMRNCEKFSNSTPMLKAFVRDVIEGEFKDSDSYDERFLKVSIKLCEDINSHAQKEGGGCFTFGNAQKLINILMKYFYLHSFGNEKEKDNFKFCHCPMDKQLLENVWNHRTELTEDIGNRTDFLSSWGNEVFSKNGEEKEFPGRYKTFQKAIKKLAKGKSSLEYDYSVWGNAGTDS